MSLALDDGPIQRVPGPPFLKQEWGEHPRRFHILLVSLAEFGHVLPLFCLRHADEQKRHGKGERSPLGF